MNRNELNQVLVDLGAHYGAELEPQTRVERCLARLHGYAVAMPPAIAQNYEGFTKATLEAEAAKRLALWQQDQPDPKWLSLGQVQSASEKGLAFEIAAELYALESFLIQLRDEASGGGDPEIEFAVEEPNGFLIPVPAIEHGRRTFARSSLRFHRILPREALGVRLRLHRLPTLGADERASDTLAGALFSDLVPRIEPQDPAEPFYVADITCADRIDQVSVHFAALRGREPCLATVWPELTGKPDVREAVRMRLVDWPLGVLANRRPILAVPGSWHEDDQGRVNRAVVFDGFGEPIFTLDKRMKFLLGDRQEDIRTGDELPILILGKRLIAFGICRDYCDAAHPTPFTDLPVDVTIVPSMGPLTAFGAHQAAAAAAYVKRSSAAFVVQQDLTGTAAAQGWVSVLRRNTASQQHRDASGIHFRTH